MHQPGHARAAAGLDNISGSLDVGALVLPPRSDDVHFRCQVDHGFVAGDRVLYFSRLISKASQSRLTRIVGTPAYQNMTIRTWTTVVKLLELLERMRP